MRLRTHDGHIVHLARELRAEPANDLRRLVDRIEGYRGEGSCLSLSLTPAFASTLAGSIGMRRRLQVALASQGLEVVTLSAPLVAQSWRAWWTYLLDLARILADLLPEDTTHGSISTPVPNIGDDPWEAAARELEDFGAGLTEIAWHTGSFIRVGCEQTETSLLNSLDDAVRLLESIDPARIGVCLDPAQLARAQETPAQALVKLRRARLSVVKVKLGRTGGQPLLRTLLGGVEVHCDHLEATTAEIMQEAREELGALGLDGASDRPMPGLGRSAA